MASSVPDDQHNFSKGVKPARVVLEPTGVYEIPVILDLASAGFKVARVNAQQIRNFAKAMGQLAKTDEIDARIIVQHDELVDEPEFRFIYTQMY